MNFYEPYVLWYENRTLFLSKVKFHLLELLGIPSFV